MNPQPPTSEVGLRETDSPSFWQTREGIFCIISLALIALGVLARATRYLQGWGAWGDEAALAINIADRDYAGLTQPLGYTQVAPVGFLWGTKLCSDLFGFNELSLRLLPFLCSIGALLLMARIARTVSREWSAVFAIGIFAVSHFQIRHSSEMKQYAVECFFSAALLALAVSAVRFRPVAAWLLVALVPVAIFSSISAVFVAGGISLALLPTIWERRSVRWFAWYAIYNAVVGMSFLALYLAVLRPMLSVHSGAMGDHWAGGLPNLWSISSIFAWVVKTATGSVFAQPMGGENGASLPFAILFWIGLIALWRSGERFFPRLVAGTFALAIVAALLRKYPLGVHPRVALYLAPLVTIPIAAGMAALVNWRPAHSTTAIRRGMAGVALLALIGLGDMVRNLVKPYHSPHVRNMQHFSRWLWTDFAATAPGSLQCVSAASLIPMPATREFEYLHARNTSVPPKRLVQIPDRIEGPTGLVTCFDPQFGDVDSVISTWRTALSERFEIFDHNTFVVDPSHTLGSRYDIVWIRPRTKSAGAAASTPAKAD